MDLQEVLDTLGAAQAGWEADGDDLLVCPCGHVIELDGRCPRGHVSPLRSAGLI